MVKRYKILGGIFLFVVLILSACLDDSKNIIFMEKVTIGVLSTKLKLLKKENLENIYLNILKRTCTCGICI